MTGYAESIQPDWDSPFGCWLWTGEVIQGEDNGQSYGKFWREYVGSWSAHRLGYHLFYPGHGYSSLVDHRCANRLCVNPSHLQAVVYREHDSLQGKRKDLQGAVEYWYFGEDSDGITPELFEFARSRDLPLRSPRENYSEPWEPYARVRLSMASAIEDILQALR